MLEREQRFIARRTQLDQEADDELCTRTETLCIAGEADTNEDW